jgi:GNAT superfamily N-acetyltransferase
MNLIEVKDKYTIREFLNLPTKLYKNVSYWIRPLDKDIEKVFDTKLNKFFRHGECIRWILQNNEGETIGRVAAFINRKTANTTEYITGGMGFFECINDKEAAFKLFDACKTWNQSKGMEAMDGPINFGERDQWWGLLVDGFDKEPNYCMPYNHPYYIQFFEEYGFKNYFEQYTYAMPVKTKLADKYYEKAMRVARDPNYHFKNYQKNKLDQFAEDFVSIYNKAWAKHGGLKGMSKTQAVSIFKQMNPIVDTDIVVFAYYKNEPIGFFIMIPELNQIFKYLDGKFDLWAKLKFLYHQKIKKSCRKMFGVAFGIIPAYQGKGVEGAIIIEAARIIQPKDKYDIFEMNWIGDFNPKMIHLVESTGAKVVKTHITYRLIFDKEKPFFRAKVIE